MLLAMRALYLVSVWLHILAAMTWVGGMVLFAVGVMPFFRGRPDAKAAFLAWFGPRFRLVSWWTFAILLTTGTFNLWARGVRPADLLRAEWQSTPFGQYVLAKLALVAVAIAISLLHERPRSRAHARWMGRSLLLIGAFIVGLAVMMVRGA
jgi:uncharacterized membrane protein